jgi:hypothetical protein
MSGKTSFQIEIPRRASRCVEGQETFEPGMDYYSLMTEGDFGIRHDFCEACWQRKASRESFKNVRGFWKSKVPLKKTESLLPKQRDARILSLLKEALFYKNSDDAAEAFILALYLARKRLLILRQELQFQEGRAHLYEVVDTEEMLCVNQMPLSEIQTEKIQLRLAHKLSGCW